MVIKIIFNGGKMKTNQGLVERIIRIAFGLGGIAGGYFMASESNYFSIGLMAAGATLVGTGIIAYCPAWHVLGISTRQQK